MKTTTMSDESLRRIYGEHTVFTRAGNFTLVHLDTPSAETVAQRLAQFDPADFFFDDCPLCVHAREEGGHVVFDGGREAPDDIAVAEEGSAAWAATPCDRCGGQYDAEDGYLCASCGQWRGTAAGLVRAGERL